jgi:hypothetical protein
MAFTQKSKFTSSGLMNRMPNKAKLINNSKTAFYQENDPNFVITEKKKALYGEDAGKDVVTGGYIKGKPGVVSRERGGIEETFAKITPEQLAKVVADGFTPDLAGYSEYVAGYNSGTLPSQRQNFQGDVKNTDPVSGTASYTYKGKPRNIDSKWINEYGLDFTVENPTWLEQREKLFSSPKFRNLKPRTRKEIAAAYKKSFLRVNPDVTFKKGPNKTKKIRNNSVGTDGTTQITELQQTN